MTKIQWKDLAAGIAITLLLLLVFVLADIKYGSVSYLKEGMADPEAFASSTSTEVETVTEEIPTWPLSLDKAEYDERILDLVNYTLPVPIQVTSTSTNADGEVVTKISTSTPASPLKYSSSINVTIDGKNWPPAASYPNGGAILPFYRILAYYGNFYSTRMGILGEYEPAEVLRHLNETKALWETADPTTPVLPAIQYIAMVAQADGGADGMYRAIMPDEEIEKAYNLAHEAGGILVIDLQVGLSTLQQELPKFKSYLERPDVHLGIDPEFAMHASGRKPGTVIGTFDAADINYAINYLADIVRENELPPKVLVVHRFTQDMVTRSSQITPKPEVQVVMDMDGWGSKDLKRGTYSHIIYPEPVQFTGIKIFYKNDLKPPSTGLLSPQEVLRLNPKPIYIQYQ